MHLARGEPQPALNELLPPDAIEPAAVPKAGVTAAVINFNTAGLTQLCVRSLLDAGLSAILVLDNGSATDDFARVRAALAPQEARVRLLRSETNLGFAEGSNRLIAEALRDPGCREILLLNSDAVVDPQGLDACLREMRESGCDLMGGRMLKPGTSGDRPAPVASTPLTAVAVRMSM